MEVGLSDGSDNPMVSRFRRFWNRSSAGWPEIDPFMSSAPAGPTQAFMRADRLLMLTSIGREIQAICCAVHPECFRPISPCAACLMLLLDFTRGSARRSGTTHTRLSGMPIRSRRATHGILTQISTRACSAEAQSRYQASMTLPACRK